MYACVVLVMRVRTEKNGEKFPRIKLNTKLNVINYFYQNILSNACAFCSYAVKVVAICLVVETKLVGICFTHSCSRPIIDCKIHEICTLKTCL